MNSDTLLDLTKLIGGIRRLGLADIESHMVTVGRFPGLVLQRIRSMSQRESERVRESQH